MSVEFDVRHGPVTAFGIAQRRDGSFRLVASAGTATPGPLLQIGNTTSRVDFGCDPGEWTDAWSATGISARTASAPRQDRLAEGLHAVYERLGGHQRLILEYKLFEPAFYHTDVPDWGTSFAHCVELGQRAQVCVDTGHHAPGTNIEFIVAFLLRTGKLGAFDFNSRFYADDDLMVGAADPFQLFRILFEVAVGGGFGEGTGIAFMLDQCHNIEPKIPAQIRSVMNVQEATAKALLVDREGLAAAQQAGDVLGANAVLMDAYNTDVRPLLAGLRSEMSLDPDPMGAYASSGYAERVGGQQAGWGA